jgi:hypothetical protein
VSSTRTTNDTEAAVPSLSVAEHVTSVSPTPKIDPEGGEHVTGRLEPDASYASGSWYSAVVFLTPFTFTTTTGGTSEKEGGVISVVCVTPTAAAPCVATAAIDPVRAVARSSRTRLVRVLERGER